MSTEQHLTWVSARDLRELGFTPTAPEHDLGHRLGAHGTIRVSFAPCGDDTFGYLYAYDAATDRYAMLSTHCTLDQVIQKFAALSASRATGDGYLALADILESDSTLTLRDARQLWMHCASSETALRHRYEQLPPDAPHRFTAAHDYIVARAARIAAEDIMLACLPVEQCALHTPVVIHYRIAGRNDWSGRIAAPDLPEAAFRVADLAAIAARQTYRVEAMSVTHGDTLVPAVRVPELHAFTRDLSAGPTSALEF